MELKSYISAMEHWSGRVDSETDYDAFRWHQWVQPLDLTEDHDDFYCEYGFAFIGFCSEEGVERNNGRIGTAKAPNYIRGKLSNLPCVFEKTVKMYDAGNIVCDDISMEEGQKLLGKAVEKILEMGLFPIVLGGGHETTFGHFLGQFADLKKNGKPLDMGIVNFDAHFDLRPYENGPTSGSMFRQIADIYKTEDISYCYLPLGIQQNSNTVSLFKYAQSNDINYILAKEIQNVNFAQVLSRIDTELFNCSSTYMTICADVFSSAFAPGVSATQAVGLEPEAVLPIIKHILRTKNVRGFDLCEISPRFDHDDATVKLGAVLIFTVVNTLCKLNNLLVIDFD